MLKATSAAMIIQALDLQIASSKRGINSKAPAFKPIYENEIRLAEEAKAEVYADQQTKVDDAKK